jgi:hypothetical protein
MPLPKRPSGGAIPKKVAPPQSGEQESSADVDFALPELDDLTLPDISFEPEAPIEKISSIPKTPKSEATVEDSSRERFNPASSTNQAAPKAAETAVSDRLPVAEDEDEETALNRELGLLDDDDLVQTNLASHDSQDHDEDDEQYADENSEDADSEDNSLIELEEELPTDSETDEEDDFADLLRDLENTISGTDDDSETDEEDSVESPALNADGLDTDWEAAFSELEAFNTDALPATYPDNDSKDEDTEDDDDSDEEEYDLSGFVPPANSFGSLPPDFDDDEADEDSDEEVPEEDDFVPPSDPFANPFANEEPRAKEPIEPEDEAEDTIEEVSEDDETPNAPRTGSLKDKVASALSPAKAKKRLANYFAKINAELHGEEPPKPRTDEEDEVNEPEQDEAFAGQTERGSRSGARLFGFFAPIRALYTGIVNFIFGILTTVLGILSKLPLIGFIFKIALEATKVLRAIAQYIPLAFFIGGLITVSYLSVPRDSLVVLPDSGGATFNNFQYDSRSNSAVGIIVNTGDIIADVQPVFEIRAIKPGLNPVSWVIPEVVSKCEAKSVQVDIDSTMNVTAKCSENITGFFPRATGELK